VPRPPDPRTRRGDPGIRATTAHADRRADTKPGGALARSAARIVQFGAVGLSGMLVDYGTFFALSTVGLRGGPTLGPLHLLWANMISVAVAIQHNFFWNRRWTFADRRRATATRQWRYFTGFSVMVWVLNNLIVGMLEGAYGRGGRLVLLDAQVEAVYLWKAIAIGTCTLANFALSTRVAFK
jgi:putative flippase GtrA